jgi:zinc transporter, ZIP family
MITVIVIWSGGAAKVLVLKVAAISFVVGVIGTAAGGLSVTLFGKPSSKALSVYLGFSAGIMIAIVAFDLMPEAFSISSTWVGLVWLVLGVLSIAALDLILPHIHHMSADKESSRHMRTAMVVLAGIMMHDLPEGLAVGAGLGPFSDVGIVVAALMFLHNIPEGMAIGAPLMAANRSRREVLIFSALGGAPSLLGGVIGVIFGQMSPAVLSASLGFSAGAMLFVSFDELIPAAQELCAEGGHSGTFGAVAGVVTAIVMSRLLGH